MSPQPPIFSAFFSAHLNATSYENLTPNFQTSFKKLFVHPPFLYDQSLLSR